MKKILTSVMSIIALLALSSNAYAVVYQELGNVYITANTLPSDGCDHTVKIGRIVYALDDSSHAMIAKVFEKLPYGKGVRQKIWYTLPGTTGTVQCGWGSQQTYPTIHISFFVPKVK